MLVATPPNNEGQRLRRLRSLGLLDTAAEQVLDDFTALAASVTGKPIALISLVDSDRQWFKSAVGLVQGGQTPRDWAFCSHLVADGAGPLFEVTDARKDPRFADNPLVTGAPRIAHYAGVPLTLPDGETIGSLCVIDQVPGRLSAAHGDFLQQLAASIVRVLLLRESDRAYRQSLDLTLRVAEAGCWEWQVPQDALWVSDSFAQRFCPLLQGRSVPLATLAGLSPPATVVRFRAAVQAVLDGSTTRLSVTHDILDPVSGGTLWLLSEGEVVERDPLDGRPLRLVGVSKNVTEAHAQQQALERERDRADRAARAKSDFLATMSHEIRTPLHGVLGLARMLQDSPLPEREAGWVRSIGQCGESLMALLSGVLDLSRIEAGALVIEDGAVDLAALVAEMRALFETRAMDKGLVFRATLGPDLPRQVRGDGLRLRQVLINLLGNAVKFTRHGGFGLALRREPGTLVMEVRDTGVGIQPEHQAAVFGAYVQAGDAPQQAQGTGLGLTIVRELMQRMGGTVSLDSRPGQGSVFTVRLPLRLEPSPPVLPVRPAVQLRPDLRVLVVDDDEVNRLVAEGLLRQLGLLRITVAEDGESALHLCASESFDLILMDCQLPGIDGREATRRLRARGWHGAILAFSAAATTEQRDACLEAGMDAYLAKPISAQGLAAALATLPLPAPAMSS